MIPRGRHLFWIRKLSASSLSRDSGRCKYEILGLQPSATQEEVKLAYYRRVKETHPDALKNAAGHEEFVELVEAYETLSCARLRAIYDSERSRRKESPIRKCERDTDDEINVEHETEPRRPVRSVYDPFRTSSDENETVRRGLHVFSNLEKEFETAFQMALHGPQIPDFEAEDMLESMMFPWAFEAEQRNRKDDERVLELVSGRQLLGFVEKSRERLLHLDSSQTGGKETKLQIDSTNDGDFDLVFQNRHVARAHKRTSTEDGRSVVAIWGTQLDKELNPSGGEEMFHLGTILPCKADSSLTRILKVLKMPHISSMLTGERTCKSSEFVPKRIPKTFEVFNAKGEAAHLAVMYSLAGIDHLYWFQRQRRRKRRKSIPICEAKATRCWFSDPLKYFFEPRSSSHGKKSWSFEMARPPLTMEEVNIVSAGFAGKESSESSSMLAEFVTQTAKRNWTVEKAAFLKRQELGALDPRVSVLHCAIASLHE